MREYAGFFVFFGGMALEAYFLPWLFVAQLLFFAVFYILTA